MAALAARLKMWASKSLGRLAQAAGTGAIAGGGGKVAGPSLGPSTRDLILLRLEEQLSGVLGPSKAEDMLVGWLAGPRTQTSVQGVLGCS